MSENGLWFRCYTDIYRNKKLRRLRADLQLLFLWCCALRKEMVLDWSDHGGIAFMLRMQPGKLRAGRIALHAAGLLDENGQPVGWEERQFESDVSTPRVKRFRERYMKRPETVTETPSETDTDTDTDSETETERKPASDDALRVSALMAELVLMSVPGAKPRPTRWPAQLDRLHRAGRPWPDIEAALRFAHRDDNGFVVLSPKALAEKFDNILAAIARAGKTAPYAGRRDVTQGNLDALAEYKRRKGLAT